MTQKPQSIRRCLFSKVFFYLFFLFAVVFLLKPISVSASAFTASVSGNWNSSATWGGGGTPGSGDTVSINSGITVTVTADASATSVTFPSSSTSATRLSINSGVTLTVSGAITIPEGTGSGTNTLAVGSGNLSAGSVAFTDAANAKKHSLSISTGTVTVTGNITIDGSNKKSANLALSGAGTLNLGGALFTGSNNSGLVTTVAGSTINYNASGAQTVRAIAYNGDVILSGSGAKSMATGITIAGNLSIAPTGSATASLTGTSTAGTLKLANVGRASGTYGSTSSSATNKNNTYFGGSGVLTVTSGSVDTTAPTISNVSSSLANGSYKTGQVVDIIVTFSESVTSTGSVTVTLDTGRTCTFSVSVSSTGTCNYTVQAGDNSSDLNVSSISGTIADPAGNSMSNFTPTTNLAANKAIVIDTTAPTVSSVTSSTTNGSYKVGSIVTVQVVFSEVVTVSGTPRLTLETGSTDRILNYVSGSGSTTLTFNYTVQNGDTSNDLDYVTTTSLAFNSSTITDTALNSATLTLPTPGASGSLGANKNIVIDTTAPTVLSVTSSNPNGYYKSGDTIIVQVVFSEVVVVNNTPHLTLATGSPVAKTTNYSGGSGTDTIEFTYNVGNNNFSSDLDYVSTGALSFSSDNSTATIKDVAGNATLGVLPVPGATGSLGANKNIIIDSTATSVTLSTTASSITNVPIPVTARFSKTVTGFDVTDISVTNGTAGSFSGTGATYTFTITPSSQGTVSFYIPSASATDLAGNSVNASNTITRTYDSIAPSVSLTTSTSSPTLTTPITYTATFSEAVTGFTLSDVSVTNATIGNFRTTSSSVYRFDVSPIGDPVLNVEVYTSIDSGKAQDAAGNLNTASDGGTPAFIRFDNHNPTLSLTSSVGEYSSSSSFSVTATFSESVTGFIVSDISVVNGTAGSFSGSGTTYTFNITPNGQGEVDVSVAAAVAVDNVLHDNLASNMLSTIYDTGAPTVELTTEESDPTNASPFSVTATFSESVTGFTVDDISVTHGTADNFSGSDTIYTFDVTADGQFLVSVDIPLGSAEDGATNGNTASNTLSLTYDSVLPVVTEVTPVPVLGPNATPSYTFNTTEAGVITYGGSCNSTTTSATSGDNTIVFSALSNGTYNDCSIIITDEAGNDSAPLIISAFTISNSNPVVTAYSPTNNSTGVSLTTDLVLTFDKEVVVGTGNILIKTGATTVETIDVTSGQVTGSGTSIITINPFVTLSSQTLYYVLIDATAFDDTFGNSYAGIASSSIWSFTSVDTTAPTVSLLSPANNSTGAPVHSSLVMTFSENVVTQSGFVTIRKVDNSIAEDISVTSGQVTGSGTNTITITPTVTLAGLTNYHVTVSATAFADTSGNNYAGISNGTTWTFQTLDTSNPFVSSFSPANFATGVSASANLVMTFDRNVFVQTSGVISVKSGGDTFESITLPDARVTGTGTTTITINPTATLLSQTVYYVNVSSTALNDLTDGTGNSFDGISDTATWTFTTADVTSPTLSGVSLISNNSLSTSFAKVGDTVALSFTSSESIATPVVTFSSGGSSVTNSTTVVNTSGNNWVASYVTNSSDTNGSVTFSINYHDIAGNNGSPNPVTSGSGSVTFDRAAPTLSSVSLTSSNSTNTQAKVGDVITLTFTSSETISTPNVSFSAGGSGVAGVVLVSHTGNDWTATYTTSSSDTAGAITYSISGFHDNANNNGTTVTSGSGSVTFDKTVPVISSVTPLSSASINNVTSSSAITFTVSETLSSGSITITRTSGASDGSSPHTCTLKGDALTSGSHTIDLSDTTDSCTSNVSNLVSGAVYTFVFAGSDVAGNAAGAITKTGIIFDNSAPTLSSVSLTSSNSTNTQAKVGDTVTLSFTSSETISTPTVVFNSGGDSTTNSVNVSNLSSNNWTATYITNSADTNGAITYSISDFEDGVGNSGVTVSSGSGSVTFDKIAPTITNVTSTKDNGTYTIGESIDVRITFSETVTSTGDVTVTLDTGGTCVFTTSSSTEGSCNYIVRDGDSSSDLTVTSISGTISDVASNNVTNFVPAVNLAENKNIVIDSTAIDTSIPTIVNVTSTKMNGTYTVDESINISVTFSENVTSTGNVTVTLDTGGTCNFIVSSSSSGSCDYIVEDGDTSSDLNVTSIAGTIKDTGLNAVTNFVPATNLSTNKEIVIDTTLPVISDVAPTSSSTITNVTSSSDIAFTSSEILTSGSITIARTFGTVDDTVHTCTLTGDALSSGVHVINLSDTTNSCTSNVSNLVSGAVYTFVFAGSDVAGNMATEVTRTEVLFDTTIPPVPVTSITVTGTGNATTITTDNGTLQMIATVLPVDATDASVTWSVAPGTGTANINGSGLLTALTDGNVTVTATARDGSGVFGELVITISGQTVPPSDTPPTVVTSGSSHSTRKTVTLSGVLTDSGSAPVTVRGFNYGETASYGMNNEETGAGFSTGSFEASIEELDCDTRYHFRAYATNSVDTTYGDDTTFKTSNCPSSSAGGSTASRSIISPVTNTIAEPVSNVPTPGLGIPGECAADQIITQNLHAPARDNQYASYTHGVVKEVKILQAHLNRLGFASGKEDGILGPISDGAIKRMQIYLGTDPDGYVGPITRGLINNSCGVKVINN